MDKIINNIPNKKIVCWLCPNIKNIRPAIKKQILAIWYNCLSFINHLLQMSDYNVIYYNKIH